MLQTSVAVGNAQLDAIETAVGTAPILRIYSGSLPADAAAALSSNPLLAEGTLPSDWMAAASSRSKAKAGTWTLTGQTTAGTGTGGTFWRLLKADGTTCVAQGTLRTAVAISTSASTAVNGNVLTFTSTTGAVAGMTVSGTGIPTGTTVIAVTSTTVTISLTSTAGVSNSTSITFGGDMNIDNVSIANAQVVTVSAFAITGGNA